ncbi:pentatricopeptide repeat-containing protein At4g02750-like [Selaginella moellendorffii]|uniref:pentatricopeptide repeat-containing protein At4g02750-like n=1 Tax=Selaginella moellendorffii TaxID=88036 RepID=UPI000D1CB71A|nr:pentatricopeptide repeat-containing protein At4g02750-like [Selaginella moellendorffii]|eukprot:XP_024515524.1 pentatricopeptide repeat-containing protein At4g02750-like [Selaginella moellendorffii]
MRWEELDGTVKLLRQCAAAKDRINGRQLHRMLVESGQDSLTLIGNLLVKMYGDCGLVGDAWAAFQRIASRNVFSWNILMAASADGGETSLAREVFNRMPSSDIVSWNAIIGILARAREIENLAAIFLAMPERDVCSWNSFISANAQTGHLNQAILAFLKMPKTQSITWNAIVSAYGDHKRILEAKVMFDRMVERDATSWNAIVGAHAMNGDLERAGDLIQRMPQNTLCSSNALLTAHCLRGRLEEARVLLLDGSRPRNLVGWSAVIGGYAQAGCGAESLQLFRAMDLDGVQPDNITFISVACAIASIPSIAQARLLLGIIRDHGLPEDTPLGTNLINMFAKCGDLEAARRVFEEMPVRDIVAWNSMLTAYAQAGRVDQSLELFYSMIAQGILPVLVSFVSILSCCSHAGLLWRSLEFFHGMSGDFELAPGFEHFRCMIDVLGRAGHLGSAEDLIQSMPFEPDGVIWNTLLGACRNYRDVERAERIALEIVRLDPELLSSYALLSGTYVNMDVHFLYFSRFQD